MKRFWESTIRQIRCLCRLWKTQRIKSDWLVTPTWWSVNGALCSDTVRIPLDSNCMIPFISKTVSLWQSKVYEWTRELIGNTNFLECLDVSDRWPCGWSSKLGVDERSGLSCGRSSFTSKQVAFFLLSFSRPFPAVLLSQQIVKICRFLGFEEVGFRCSNSIVLSPCCSQNEIEFRCGPPTPWPLAEGLSVN